MMVESDVIVAIQQLEYVKAKYSFSKFLKRVMQILLHQNPHLNLENFQSVSSIIFYILSTGTGGSQKNINSINVYFNLLEKCTLDINFPDLLMDKQSTLIDLKKEEGFELINYEKKSEGEWKIIVKLISSLETFKDNIIQILGTSSMSQDTLRELNSKISDMYYSNSQYKDLLRYLSESLFKYMGCRKLTFQNDIELESYVNGKNDIGDDLALCHYDGKIKVMIELWNSLNTLEATQSPLATVQQISDLINLTNSASLSEFVKEINYIVDRYGGGRESTTIFSWARLRRELETGAVEPTSSTTSDLVNAVESKITTEQSKPIHLYDSNITTSDLDHARKETENYEREIVLDSRSVFGSTVLEVLGKTGEPGETMASLLETTSSSQMYNRVNTFLNEFFVARLNEILRGVVGAGVGGMVGKQQNVTEHELKSLFDKCNQYKNLYERVTKLLETTDTNRIVFKIRSMMALLNKFYEFFNTSNENIIINELENYKRVTAIFKSINENMLSYFENINNAMNISGCNSTKQLVGDLNSVCQSFYSINNEDACSLRIIAKFLTSINEKIENSIRFEKQFKELESENGRLKEKFQPIHDIERTFEITLSEIVEFIDSVLHIKPLKSKSKTFFDKCVSSLQSHEQLKQNNMFLRKSEEGLKNYVQSLESELSAASEYKIKLNYSEQQLHELRVRFSEIETENNSLKENNEAFENAISIATTYINERNTYIDELENEIKRLKEK